jgi:hypothetical protein
MALFFVLAGTWRRAGPVVYTKTFFQRILMISNAIVVLAAIQSTAAILELFVAIGRALAGLF